MKYLVTLIFIISFINGFSFIKIDSVNSSESKCNNTGSLTIHATSSSQIFYKLEYSSTSTPLQTNNVFQNLTPGIYKVKISNVANDLDSMNIMVTGNYLTPDFSPIVRATSCSNNSDGIIIGNPSINKGLKPYQWKLKNISTGVTLTQNTDTFINLKKGDYNLTLTDSCANVISRNFSLLSTSTSIGLSSSMNYRIIDCSKFTMTAAYNYNGAVPSRIKYEYLGNTIIKTPNFLNATTIFDTIPFNFSTNKLVTITIYNHCGDSAKRSYSTGNGSLQISAEIIGCDSTRVTFTTSNFGLGYVFASANLITKNGIQSLTNINSFTFSRILANITHGDSIQYQLISQCNDTIKGKITITKFINYYLLYQESILENCSSKYYYRLSMTSSYRTKGLVNFKLINKTTRAILLDSSVSNTLGIFLRDFPTNQNYVLHITNGCGIIDSLSFHWDTTKPIIRSVELRKDYQNACLDSTVGMVIIPKGFIDPKLKNFTGSINKIVNTKSKYQYNANLNYAQFNNIGANINIQNIGVGKYYFTIHDTCGYIDTNIEFFHEDVSNNFYSSQLVKSCFDDNKIILKLSSQNWASFSTKVVSGTYSIFDIERNVFLRSNSSIGFTYTYFSNFLKTDTFKNLMHGKYIIKINYTKRTSTPANHVYLTANPLCNEIVDTVSIPQYNSPRVKVVSKVVCNNTKHVLLLVDSTTGLPPYRFEINSGVETFPIQTSNKFIINQIGNYQARIWDNCGNANTFNFTVDTFKFDPIIVSDTSCNPESVSLGYFISPNVSYRWKKPNGNFHFGNTLSFSPIGISDIGLYKITKFVEIDGCKDSFLTTYNLVKSKQTYTLDTIYKGDTFSFNSKALTISGIYRDTFTAFPCDSLSILNLFVYDSQVVKYIYKHICYGDTLHFKDKKYFSSGVYYDTFENAQKIDSIFVTILTVNDSFPSVTRFDTLKNGDSTFFRSRYLYDSGAYHDTVGSSPCDSIYSLYLYVRDTTIVVKDYKRICAGDSILFHGIYYKYSGIYTHFIAVSRKPDTLYELHLVLNPEVKYNQSNSKHCTHYVLGINTIQSDTSIIDTIRSSLGCDSIISTVNYLIFKTKLLNDSVISSCDFVKLGNKIFYKSTIKADSIRIQFRNYSSCDSLKRYINIEIKPRPLLTITPSKPNLLNTGETVYLRANGASKYVWNMTESSTDEISYLAYKNKNFTLIGTSAEGCNDTAYYRVMLKDSFYSTVSIPTAFTPNGDGNNDVLFIKLFGVKKLISFKVFNRFGQLIFMTDNESQGWDGYYKGTLQNSEVYYYTYEIETHETKRIIGNGNLILLH